MKTSIETNRNSILEKISRHIQNEMTILKSDVRVTFGNWTDNTNCIFVRSESLCVNESIEFDSKNEVVNITNATEIKNCIGSELFELVTDRNAMDELYSK